VPGGAARFVTTPLAHISCSRWCYRTTGRRGTTRPAASGRRTACS